MKHNEQIKLNNFAAHYNKLKGNLQDVNKELEDVLSKVDTKKVYYRQLAQRVNDEHVELNMLHTVIANINKNKDRVNLFVQDQEKLSRNLEEQITEAEELLKGKQTVAERKASAYVSDKNSELKEIQKEIDTKTEEFNSIEVKITNAEKRLSDEIDTYKKEILINLLLIEDEEEELDGLKLTVGEKKKEIKTLIRDVEKSKTAITEPDKQLDERANRLEEKERNFYILTLRWEKFFKEHFPGQELKL